MKLLIVEDRMDKQNDIKRVIMGRYHGEIEIDTVSNYFSACNMVISKNDYFMLIIDMFLPDAKDDDELRGLAGKDLIFDMSEENIWIPTLVVTQYTEYTGDVPSRCQDGIPEKRFMENPFYKRELPEQPKRTFDCTYLAGLHEYLCAEIPFYLGILYYSNQFRDWENNLLYFIDKIEKDGEVENTVT